MFPRGFMLGIALSVSAVMWLRSQRVKSIDAETTIHLPAVASSAVVQSVATILDRIEATAPWIRRANEKSSTKS